MKGPVCNVCASTRVLCSSCSEKYRLGLVTDLDLDIMKVLIELENNIKELREAEFIKSYKISSEEEGKQAIIIVLRHPQRLNFTILSRISRRLSKILNNNVKVIQKLDQAKDILSQLMYPLRVYGVNIMWLPDGSIEYDVLLRRVETKRLKMDLKQVSDIASDILGRRVRFTFM